MVWVGHANVQFGCPARHLLQASFHGIRNLHVLTPSTLSNIVATRFKRTGVAFNCGEICLLRHNLSQLLQTRQALTNTWQSFAIVSGRHLFRECTARQRVKHLIFFLQNSFMFASYLFPCHNLKRDPCCFLIRQISICFISHHRLIKYHFFVTLPGSDAGLQPCDMRTGQDAQPVLCAYPTKTPLQHDITIPFEPQQWDAFKI